MPLRLFYSLLLLICFETATSQVTNWNETTHEASVYNKPILLVFSGSDWCRGCILFDNNVLQKEAFQTLHPKQVLLYKADFPRKKKLQPPLPIKAQNETLAQQYNPNGIFPYILLLDSDLNVLLEEQGNIDPAQFMATMSRFLKTP